MEDSFEKANYRQVGREVTGKIARGFVSNPIAKQTSSSIPYKFETVLYKNNNPRGFGSCVTRFSNIDDLAPGPGSYDGNRSFTLDNNPSKSKKGYGNGFVSTTNRLSTGVYCNTGPGPGSYSIKEKKRNFPHVTPSNTAFNRSMSTDTRSTNNESIDIPGPGQYDPDVSYISQVSNPKDVSSAFKAKGKADNVIKTDAPPPGYYDVDRSLLLKKHYLEPPHSSYFMKPTKRIMSEEQAKKSLLNQLLDKDESETQTDVSFQREQDIALFNQKINNKNNAVFMLNNMTRFGEIVSKKAKKIEMPGPGAYVKIESETEKQLVSGAVFMSEVPRKAFSSKNRNLIPPTRYNPETINKKSYHLNMNKLWM